MTTDKKRRDREVESHHDYVRPEVNMSKYRKQVMEYAERKAEVVVQFAGMAGIYELPRSSPSFDPFASLLRAAKDSGIPISFEIDGNRIVSVG